MEKIKRVKIQSPEELLEKNIISSIQTKKELLVAGPQLREFSRAALHVVECYRSGGRLYIAGNGGSAADAQHLAAEFVSKLSRDREPLPAEALTVDTSVLTAIGNDYGYDQIFARQVYGKMTKRDIFLGITTSGNSPNILRGLEACRAKEIPTIVFTGNDGGNTLQLADYCIIAPGNSTAKIQEIHILLAHSLCEFVETVLFN